MTKALVLTSLLSGLALQGQSFTTPPSSLAAVARRSYVPAATMSLAPTPDEESRRGRSTSESGGSSWLKKAMVLGHMGSRVNEKSSETRNGKAKLDFVGECELPTQFGDFKLRAYRTGALDGSVHEPTVVIAGDVSGDDVVVRVHDQCMTSEVLGSTRCDCKEQLEDTMRLLGETGRGIIIYLQQEGRGIGLANKIAAYGLQDTGLDTVDANLKLGFADESRTYDVVPTILDDLGINSIKLLTNNPFKVKSLEALGVKINDRMPILVAPKPTNEGYLRTKALRMSHMLPADMLVANANPGAASAQAASAQAAAKGASEHVSAAAVAETETFTNPLNGRVHSWCMGRESVEKTISAIGKGEVVVVTDDEDRENEGDLIMAAELATPEAIAFFIRYTSGVLCVGMNSDRLDELELPQMVSNNQDPKNTAFTLSVDALVGGISTGISATDRATTLRLLADKASSADMFCRPGHIFPLRAKAGGTIERGGHTEASVDLCRMAGLAGAGVLCEIVTADSMGMARMPELLKFAEEHKLAFTTIEDMICYRIDTGDFEGAADLEAKRGESAVVA
mmetsp:Transcript_24036/g.55298  ORF Transcript_24036/g.55298 Transcript_24036/m.55298 type:complete len:567 (+) Transcript_24036:122-1822(+)|eukprot:CAMPEP_0182560332 /NCGR_PEP_ID=MMETSP1324-20130603/3072_1 /TAXON_ID=236786 /ORGANISM="Florenciella sp., Strain RCC1587" /LENGTH=566 /DNA_ID=CAMNT_0024772675 /DNA_START=36 /DNA_END=1736 /DNA_ORIENTATION=-